jgi:hypothetical protein
MLFTQAVECGLSGAAEIFRRQALSTGNSGHPAMLAEPVATVTGAAAGVDGVEAFTVGRLTGTGGWLVVGTGRALAELRGCADVTAGCVDFAVLIALRVVGAAVEELSDWGADVDGAASR